MRVPLPGSVDHLVFGPEGEAKPGRAGKKLRDHLASLSAVDKVLYTVFVQTTSCAPVVFLPCVSSDPPCPPPVAERSEKDPQAPRLRSSEVEGQVRPTNSYRQGSPGRACRRGRSQLGLAPRWFQVFDTLNPKPFSSKTPNFSPNKETPYPNPTSCNQPHNC